MIRKFGRVAQVVVQTGAEQRTIMGHRIVFQVEAFAGPAMSRGVVRMFNLGEDTQRVLARRKTDFQQSPFTHVFLYAGYQNADSLVLRGNLLRGTNIRVGPDWITELEVIPFFEQRVNAMVLPASRFSFTDTPPMLILDRLFEVLAAGEPRFSTEARVKLSTAAAISGSYSGRAIDEIRRLLARYGLTFSLHNEGPLVVKEGGAMNPDDPAAALITLNQTTGLIGTPQITDYGVTVKTLLDPRLNPLLRFIVESPTIARTLQVRAQEYSAIRVKHVGDTRGEDWFTEVDAAYYPPEALVTSQPAPPPSPMIAP